MALTELSRAQVLQARQKEERSIKTDPKPDLKPEAEPVAPKRTDRKKASIFANDDDE